jgi:hypothetical protein
MMADPSKDLRDAASSARVLLSRSRSWPYDPWVLRVKAETFIGLSQRLDGPSPSPAVRPPASECFLLTLALGDIGGRVGVVAFGLGRRRCAAGLRGG